MARCERHSGVVRAIAVSADGKYLASVGDDRMCYILNAVTLKVSRQYGPQGAPLTGVAFMRDMTLISSGIRDKARPGDGTIRFWDWNTADVRRIMPDSEFNSHALVLSADEKKIGVGMGGPSARMYQLASNSRMGLETPWPDRKCNAVAISPDSNVLAAGCGGGIVLWHISDEKKGPGPDLPGDNTSEVNAIDFAPDGKWVIAAHADGVLRRWNLADQSLAAKLPAHTGAAHDVAVSPDGKLIASGGEDKTIRIWDAATGKETLRLAGHSGAVSCVLFAADSKHL
jgi:WD40 repeat protein